MLGIRADLLAIEDMDHPKLLDQAVVKLAKRYMNPLFTVMPRDAAPSSTGWLGAEKRDARFPRVQAGRCQQPLL